MTIQPEIDLKQYRGRGRVEFLAVKEEIQTMTAKGYTPTMMYNVLYGQGKITISRKQFWTYLSGKPDKRKIQRMKAGSQPETLPVSLPETPVLPAPMDSTSTFKPGSFDYDPEKAAQKKDF